MHLGHVPTLILGKVFYQDLIAHHVYDTGTDCTVLFKKSVNLDIEAKGSIKITEEHANNHLLQKDHYI